MDIQPVPRPTYAAIDLGTNNCRMLIAEKGKRGRPFRIVDRFSRVVRLGEGLAGSGRLGVAAMDRALEALRLCAGRMDLFGVRVSRGVATEACRRADNGAAFLRRVQEDTGLVLEVIDAAQEARLTLAGCVGHLDSACDHAVLVDIGGGSTEVSWIVRRDSGTDLHVLDSLSLPYGVVLLAEEYGHGILATSSYRALMDRVGRDLETFDADNGISRRLATAPAGVRMLGTSGTMTTLGALHLNLEVYDRERVDGLDVPFSAIVAMARELNALDNAARAAHPCIGPERADLVAVGCAVLEAICHRWPVGRLRLADRGIREGLLESLMAEKRS